MDTRDVSFRFVSYCLVYLPINIRFVLYGLGRFISFHSYFTKRMKRLGCRRETKRNETFELILIDKSVGPQESGRRAAMQCVMSAGEVAIDCGANDAQVWMHSYIWSRLVADLSMVERHGWVVV